MNKVFGVELSNSKGCYCELDLPATDYELLDALEKLQMKPGEQPTWEITEHTYYRYLQVYLDGECDLYQLNELSRRLEKMSIEEQGCFEGLFHIALHERSGPMSIKDLFTYTENTDKCLIIDARNDEELGHFYVENGFLPELEQIPEPLLEQVLPRLDYAGIGKQFRCSEHGIYARGCYILQHSELIPSEMFISPLRTPDYAFRLEIGRYDFEHNREPPLVVPLELPASEDKLTAALEEIEAASWDEVVMAVEDSAIPGLVDDMNDASIHKLNELAKQIKYRERRGELMKLKGACEVICPQSVEPAIWIADQLDDYLLEASLRTPEEVARDDIQLSVDEPLCTLLLKHTNLHEMGREILNAPYISMTNYGLFHRRDCSQLQRQETNHQIQSM